MTWSEQYINILLEHHNEWITLKGNTDGRFQLVRTVADAIKEFHQEKELESSPPTELKKVQQHHKDFYIHIKHSSTESTDVVPEPLQVSKGPRPRKQEQGHPQLHKEIHG